MLVGRTVTESPAVALEQGGALKSGGEGIKFVAQRIVIAKPASPQRRAKKQLEARSPVEPEEKQPRPKSLLQARSSSSSSAASAGASSASSATRLADVLSAIKEEEAEEASRRRDAERRATRRARSAQRTRAAAHSRRDEISRRVDELLESQQAVQKQRPNESLHVRLERVRQQAEAAILAQRQQQQPPPDDPRGVLGPHVRVRDHSAKAREIAAELDTQKLLDLCDPNAGHPPPPPEEDEKGQEGRRRNDRSQKKHKTPPRRRRTTKQQPETQPAAPQEPPPYRSAGFSVPDEKERSHLAAIALKQHREEEAKRRAEGQRKQERMREYNELLRKRRAEQRDNKENSPRPPQQQQGDDAKKADKPKPKKRGSSAPAARRRPEQKQQQQHTQQPNPMSLDDVDAVLEGDSKQPSRQRRERRKPVRIDTGLGARADRIRARKKKRADKQARRGGAASGDGAAAAGGGEAGAGAGKIKEEDLDNMFEEGANKEKKPVDPDVQRKKEVRSFLAQQKRERAKRRRQEAEEEKKRRQRREEELKKLEDFHKQQLEKDHQSGAGDGKRKPRRRRAANKPLRVPAPDSLASSEDDDDDEVSDSDGGGGEKRKAAAKSPYDDDAFEDFEDEEDAGAGAAHASVGGEGGGGALEALSEQLEAANKRTADVDAHRIGDILLIEDDEPSSPDDDVPPPPFRGSPQDPRLLELQGRLRGLLDHASELQQKRAALLERVTRYPGLSSPRTPPHRRRSSPGKGGSSPGGAPPAASPARERIAAIHEAAGAFSQRLKQLVQQSRPILEMRMSPPRSHKKLASGDGPVRLGPSAVRHIDAEPSSSPSRQSPVPVEDQGTDSVELKRDLAALAAAFRQHELSASLDQEADESLPPSVASSVHRTAAALVGERDDFKEEPAALVERREPEPKFPPSRMAARRQAGGDWADPNAELAAFRAQDDDEEDLADVVADAREHGPRADYSVVTAIAERYFKEVEERDAEPVHDKKEEREVADDDVDDVPVKLPAREDEQQKAVEHKEEEEDVGSTPLPDEKRDDDHIKEEEKQQQPPKAAPSKPPTVEPVSVPLTYEPPSLSEEEDEDYQQDDADEDEDEQPELDEPRLSPQSLARQLRAEVVMLDTVRESERQLVDLERARRLDQVQKETAQLEELLRERTAAVEARRNEELKTLAHIQQEEMANIDSDATAQVEAQRALHEAEMRAVQAEAKAREAKVLQELVKARAAVDGLKDTIARQDAAFERERELHQQHSTEVGSMLAVQQQQADTIQAHHDEVQRIRGVVEGIVLEPSPVRRARKPPRQREAKQPPAPEPAPLQRPSESSLSIAEEIEADESAAAPIAQSTSMVSIAESIEGDVEEPVDHRDDVVVDVRDSGASSTYSSDFEDSELGASRSARVPTRQSAPLSKQLPPLQQPRQQLQQQSPRPPLSFESNPAATGDEIEVLQRSRQSVMKRRKLRLEYLAARQDGQIPGQAPLVQHKYEDEIEKVELTYRSELADVEAAMARAYARLQRQQVRTAKRERDARKSGAQNVALERKIQGADDDDDDRDSSVFSLPSSSHSSPRPVWQHPFLPGPSDQSPPPPRRQKEEPAPVAAPQREEPHQSAQPPPHDDEHDARVAAAAAPVTARSMEDSSVSTEISFDEDHPSSSAVEQQEEPEQVSFTEEDDTQAQLNRFKAELSASRSDLLAALAGDDQQAADEVETGGDVVEDSVDLDAAEALLAGDEDAYEDTFIDDKEEEAEEEEEPLALPPAVNDDELDESIEEELDDELEEELPAAADDGDGLGVYAPVAAPTTKTPDDDVDGTEERPSQQQQQSLDETYGDDTFVEDESVSVSRVRDAPTADDEYEESFIEDDVEDEATSTIHTDAARSFAADLSASLLDESLDEASVDTVAALAKERRAAQDKRKGPSSAAVEEVLEEELDEAVKEAAVILERHDWRPPPPPLDERAVRDEQHVAADRHSAQEDDEELHAPPSASDKQRVESPPLSPTLPSAIEVDPPSHAVLSPETSPRQLRARAPQAESSVIGEAPRAVPLLSLKEVGPSTPSPDHSPMDPSPVSSGGSLSPREVERFNAHAITTSPTRRDSVSSTVEVEESDSGTIGYVHQLLTEYLAGHDVRSRIARAASSENEALVEEALIPEAVFRRVLARSIASQKRRKKEKEQREKHPRAGKRAGAKPRKLAPLTLGIQPPEEAKAITLLTQEVIDDDAVSEASSNTSGMADEVQNTFDRLVFDSLNQTISDLVTLVREPTDPWIKYKNRAQAQARRERARQMSDDDIVDTVAGFFQNTPRPLPEIFELLPQTGNTGAPTQHMLNMAKAERERQEFELIDNIIQLEAKQQGQPGAAATFEDWDDYEEEDVGVRFDIAEGLLEDLLEDTVRAVDAIFVEHGMQDEPLYVPPPDTPHSASGSHMQQSGFSYGDDYDEDDDDDEEDDDEYDDDEEE